MGRRGRVSVSHPSCCTMPQRLLRVACYFVAICGVCVCIYERSGTIFLENSALDLCLFFLPYRVSLWLRCFPANQPLYIHTHFNFLKCGLQWNIISIHKQFSSYRHLHSGSFLPHIAIILYISVIYCRPTCKTHSLFSGHIITRAQSRC